MLWAAHKAVIWVYLISIAAAKRKRKPADSTRLSRELTKLYHIHNQSHSPNTLWQISTKKIELDTVLSEQTEKTLRWSKATFLLHNNLALAMFARKLNSTIQPPHLYKLRNDRGDMATHPSEVLKISKFYQDLLAAPSSLPGPSTKSWLDGLTLPSLTKEQTNALNAPHRGNMGNNCLPETLYGPRTERIFFHILYKIFRSVDPTFSKAI